MERLLKTKSKYFPSEYALYRFCKDFHCLPHEALAMEEHWYVLFREFQHAEGENAMMEAKRAQSRPPHGRH